jgi:hypothetical protein
MSASQITSISCLPCWTAKLSDGGDNKREVVFNRGDALIHLTPGSSWNTLLMRESVSISSMSLRRVAARPNNCSDKMANAPQNNYERSGKPLPTKMQRKDSIAARTHSWL